MRYTPKQENLPTDIADHRVALSARLLHKRLALIDVYPHSNFGSNPINELECKTFVGDEIQNISKTASIFIYYFISENVLLIDVYPSSNFCSNPNINRWDIPPKQENRPTDIAAHRVALGARLQHTRLALIHVYPHINFGSNPTKVHEL